MLVTVLLGILLINNQLGAQFLSYIHRVGQKYVYSIYYTVCPRRNGQNFGRVFLMLNYTDITQNTYIQSLTVTEIMAREV